MGLSSQGTVAYGVVPPWTPPNVDIPDDPPWTQTITTYSSPVESTQTAKELRKIRKVLQKILDILGELAVKDG